MNNTFILELNKSISPNPNNNFYEDIWKEYEKVILQSLITTFGLDFIIRDQDGGDVDTILGVKNSGRFKNENYNIQYSQRESYDHKYVEGPGSRYNAMKSGARIRYGEDNHNNFVIDAYEDKPLHFLGKGPNYPTEIKAELDHVIAAKSIYDDKGRLLSGLSAKELADSEYNLQWTNAHLNKSMKDVEIPEYISKHPELSEDIKSRMQSIYDKAKEDYDDKIAKAYYLGQSFRNDILKASAKVGFEMGLRQAVGMIFIEIYVACKKELYAVESDSSFDDYFSAAVKGVKQGIDNSKNNYEELFRQFEEGFVAGVFSSISTTLINIFIYTKKNTVKYIRYGLTAAVQAINVLLVNPDDLLLGEQFKSAGIIMATGASNIVGSYVGDGLMKSPVGKIPQVGTYICTFTSLLVSGLTSCTILLAADRSKYIKSVIHEMNQYRTDFQITKEYSRRFIQLAAELSGLDIDCFEAETTKYLTIAKIVFQNPDGKEMNSILVNYFDNNNIEIPWGDDFDSFMESEEAVLSF